MSGNFVLTIIWRSLVDILKSQLSYLICLDVGFEDGDSAYISNDVSQELFSLYFDFAAANSKPNPQGSIDIPAYIFSRGKA